MYRPEDAECLDILRIYTTIDPQYLLWFAAHRRVHSSSMDLRTDCPFKSWNELF